VLALFPSIRQPVTAAGLRPGRRALAYAIYTYEYIAREIPSHSASFPLFTAASSGPYSRYIYRDIASFQNVSLLPPIPTSFRAATALPPLIKLDRRTDVSDPAAPQPAVSAVGHAG
jgi:hypothetical protein